MNQRIAELMRNHGLHKHISTDCQNRMEMLAELIVKDCIQIVEGYCETSPEIMGLPLDILEHFDMEIDDE